jgi:hypothetical protein
MFTHIEKKLRVLCILLLIFTILIFAGCPNLTSLGGTDSGSDPNGGDTNSDPNGGDTNKEILQELGITPDDSPPVNGNNEEVSGTMNPLGGKITTLGKVYEIAQVGADIAGMGPYSLSEHNGETDSGLTIVPGFSKDEPWMSFPKKSLAADIDADGKDNVITAVFNGANGVNEIYLMVQNADESLDKKYIQDDSGNNIETFDFMGNFGERPWLTDYFMMRDFTTGDFDGDRDPEFVISCMTGVVIFDHEFKLIGSLVLPDKGDDNYPYVRVEAGDLNKDNYDDLVVINGCMKVTHQDEPGDIHILAGSASGLGVTGEEGDITDFAERSDVMKNDATGVQFSSAEVVIFDADHDGYKELALAGVNSNYGGSDDTFGWNCTLEILLRYIDPFNETSGNFQNTQLDVDGNLVADKLIGNPTSYSGWHHPRNFAVPRMVAGHFAPGERDMVNVLDLMMFINDSGEWEAFEQFIYTTADIERFHDMAYDTAVAGDVTGNGLDELVYTTWTALPWENSIGGDGKRSNVMSSISVWGQDKTSKTYEILETKTCDSSNEFPTLALANVDDDSIVLEYLGHTLTYSAPKILTVMASPPYFSELGDDMDIGNSATSFAISDSEGSGSTVNWGFHVDVIVGVSLETPEGSTGLDVTGTVTNSWDWSWGQMYTKSTTLEYAVNAGFDQVIFAGVPIDVYCYRVISYGEGTYNDPGETITINVPRKPQTSSVELNFYNKIVPEECRIPDDFLKHDIGEPFSYYTAAEKAEFATNATILSQEWLFSSSTMGVSQGSSLNTISTESDVSSTTTFDYDLGLDVEITAKVGYVVGGYNIGAHVGYGYTYEVSDGVEVSGSVGSIADPTLWTEYGFNWGLMMIPQSFGDQKFNLVSYWVEGS